MDEEITIIDSKTRNEKIKNFLIEKRKIIIFIVSFLILGLLSFYSFNAYKESNKKKLSDRYNKLIIEYKDTDKTTVISSMIEIINYKDSTYSPLALYFLIDNNLIQDRNKINSLFDILINKTALEFEIKNLIIYKKALYNADVANENELLDILDPLIKSKSVWRSHALYLVGEYFYSKNNKLKSKEFFSEILIIKNANHDILKEAQKRLNRDLSD
tara:strand:- start:27 stop:671 length:645 start_codon:yes stop_codon:yes gene_type:complete